MLALIYREPGHEAVAELLAGSMVSAVNWAEVVAKLAQRGHPDPSAAADAIRALGIDVVPFTAAHAVAVGLLWPSTRGAGLSLGDRACLALASMTADGVAVTSDQAWAKVDLAGVEVRLIR